MSKIYVGNLPFSATEGTLENFISEFGFAVDEVHIIRDMHSGRSKGFGFVTLSESVDGDEAISTLDGKSLDGRTLRVDRAREKRPGRNQDRSGGHNRWS